MKLKTISLLLLFYCLDSYCQKTENYLLNADFENWTTSSSLTNWSITNATANNSSITQEITETITGSNTAVKFEASDIANKGVLNPSGSGTTITEPGKYFFGLWIKTTSGNKIKIGFKKDPGDGGSNVFTAQTYEAPDNNWHFVVNRIDVVVDDVLLPRIIPETPSVTFYFDNAIFGQGLAGKSSDWDYLPPNTARDNVNFFYISATYGSSINGVLSENTDPTYIKSGYTSLKYMTNADASNSKRGALQFKDNADNGLRYVHPESISRNYQASVWIYNASATSSDVVFNLKVGSTNNFKPITLSSESWTQITSSIVNVSSETDKIYPVIQFKDPDKTFYLDDFYLNWSDEVNWEGSNDSDWNNDGNWSTNKVPNSISDITIPSNLSNYPTSSNPVTVNSVNMADGASLIANSSFGGSITYTRSGLSTANDWYGISSPVNGQDINDFITTSVLRQSGDGTLWGISSSYASFTDTWNYYSQEQTGIGNFTPSKGYIINLANDATGTISFTGTLRTSDQTRAISHFGNSFSFVANPFTSYINISEMLNSNEDVLETKTIWIWDNTANGGAGGYVTHIAAETDFNLAPTQAFFVQTKLEATVNETLSLLKSHQTHDNTDTFSRNSSLTQLNLKITDDDSRIRETKILYVQDATLGFDNGFDGPLFQGVNNEFAIYTHEVENDSGKDLAIQSVPDNDYENIIIPVGVNAESGTQITFSASTLNFPNGTGVYIEDTQNNTYNSLNDNSDYTTTLNTSLDGSGRFYIHTSQNILGIRDNVVDIINIRSINKRLLKVTGIKSGKVNFNLYDLLGKNVLVTSFIGKGSNNISLPELSQGIYIVKLTNDNYTTSKKIIIK